MTEFDLICNMFRDKHIVEPEADGSYLLVETKEATDRNDHIVKSWKQPPIKEVAVFRFSIDNEDFLPFFKDVREPENGPRHLKKFCDFIMLVHNDKKLNIILIELKRSHSSPDRTQQLHASELFMRYIIDSAERIKHINGCDDFDPARITMRKVCLKEFPGLKNRANAAELFRNIETDKIVTLNNYTIFFPHWTFCNK